MLIGAHCGVLPNLLLKWGAQVNCSHGSTQTPNFGGTQVAAPWSIARPGANAASPSTPSWC